MDRHKTILVEKSAHLLGHKLSWEKTVRIADRFTLSELLRIYNKINSTGRRVYVCKKIN